MIKDLKAFLFRGDVLTLAVAVVIGGAFQKIVDSLVEDIIKPILGVLTGGANFSDHFIALSDKVGGEASYAKAKELGAVLGWGSFLQATINFIIVGIVLFFIIKAAGKSAQPK